MTNEEIEAARERARNGLNWLAIQVGSLPQQSAVAHAVIANIGTELDALCEAARQPESLVGRRVRMKDVDDYAGTVGRITNVSFCIRFRSEEKGWTDDFDEGDFELLEDDDPMGGVWRCEYCGDLLNSMDGRWRMAGDRWQHSHGQAGHIDARYFGPSGDTNAE